MSTQMILVMDHAELPKHIKHTFKLSESTGGRGWKSGLEGIEVAVEGDHLDLEAGGYVVVYASNTWHRSAGEQLYNQIKSLRHDAVVVMLPVEVEAIRADGWVRSALDGGGVFTIPQVP